MSAALGKQDAAPLESDEAVSLTVAWIGDRPQWIDDEHARAELAGVSFRPLGSPGSTPLVIHARGDALQVLDGRRRGVQERLVVDLVGVERLGRVERRVARGADIVLVEEGRGPGLGGDGEGPRVASFRPPLDLRSNAPEAALSETRDSELKRFRRMHRLTPSTVLYAGPYTEEGGLHRVFEAAMTLRERREDLAIAAIPYGRVDRGYRDACERRALALGHRGIVEWTVEPGIVPLWFALAAVVCLPCTAPVDPLSALLAAAAARPFVGGDGEALRREVVDGTTGFLLDATDRDGLVARIDSLLVDREAATAMGNEARRRVEREHSPEAAAGQLRRLWEGVELGP